jgi:hypothetical protein
MIRRPIALVLTVVATLCACASRHGDALKGYNFPDELDFMLRTCGSAMVIICPRLARPATEELMREAAPALDRPPQIT